MSQRVVVSTQVDVLDLAGAVDAAGASEEEVGGTAATMSLGGAVWRRMRGLS